MPSSSDSCGITACHRKEPPPAVPWNQRERDGEREMERWRERDTDTDMETNRAVWRRTVRVADHLVGVGRRPSLRDHALVLLDCLEQLLAGRDLAPGAGRQGTGARRTGGQEDRRRRRRRRRTRRTRRREEADRGEQMEEVIRSISVLGSTWIFVGLCYSVVSVL